MADDDRAENRREGFLSFTALIPILTAWWFGSDVFQLLGLDRLPLSEDQWLGRQAIELLHQTVWIPMAVVFVRIWGWMLGLLGLIPPYRVARYPFGLRFGG